MCLDDPTHMLTHTQLKKGGTGGETDEEKGRGREERRMGKRLGKGRGGREADPSGHIRVAPTSLLSPPGT